MATFTAVKNRGGGRGALGGVTRYVSQKEKTLWERQRLVTGWNCTAQSVLSEMQLTKERFRKTDGRQYYHFVQSFAETDDLTPQEAHAIALELAQREFPNFEVLVATHIDTDHLHSHLIVNSVSFLDGKKLHQSAAGLQAHRTVNDEICAAHGLAILPPPERQVERKRMSSREYRSAAKGESRKFRLMNTIDQCMRYASTKEEFLSLMESEGYQVHWTDGRKNITYTTPTGMKCRDDRLHETKYTKEIMEHEFQIRAEIVSGGIEGAERSADYDTAGLSQQGGVAGVAPSGWTSWSGTRRPTQPFCGRFPAGRNCTPPRSSWRHCRGGQMCTELKRAGRKKEISILPPGLDTALSVPAWLLLLGTLVGMVALRTIWSGLAAVWSVVRVLIP